MAIGPGRQTDDPVRAEVLGGFISSKQLELSRLVSRLSTRRAGSASPEQAQKALIGKIKKERR